MCHFCTIMTRLIWVLFDTLSWDSNIETAFPLKYLTWKMCLRITGRTKVTVNYNFQSPSLTEGSYLFQLDCTLKCSLNDIMES